MAGGLTEKVDSQSVNLAYKLDKNMMIRIRETSMIQYEEAMGIAVYDEQMKDIMVNINTADVDELSRLPGIGQATADAIISYRTQHGRFKTIADIMNVTGIKEAKFDAIRDFICVE
jgi:competence protein ComEA